MPAYSYYVGRASPFDMNGRILLNEGYERGLDPKTTLYRPIDPYFHLIRRFTDNDYFGVMGRERGDPANPLVPMHVNGDDNPFPWRDRKGKKCRRTFKKKDAFLHLCAEPHDEKPEFRFLVNSPKAHQHLLGLDIDADDDRVGHEITCEVYHDLFCATEDYGGHVHIERSRNRVGRYIWSIIERSSSPAEFNLLLNALSRAMKAKYRVDDDNKFDAIKGTLHFDSRDEFTKMWAEADGNPNDDNRGVLMTMPLAGTVARGEYEAAWLAFSHFAKYRKGKRRGFVHAIPEAHFRSFLSAISPAESQRLDGEVAKLREQIEARLKPLPPAPTAPPSTLGNDLRVSAPKKEGETRQRLRDKAHAETSGKNRMRYASSLYFYAHGCYAPTPDALLAFYKAEGFNKGDDTPAKEIVRLRRADEALRDHRNNPASTGGYDAAYWIEVIETYVKAKHRDHPKVKYRSPRTQKPMLVETELLAAGLYVLTTSAFACNTPDRKHSCSQVGQESFYSTLADEGVLTCKFDDKKKRVAVPVILQLAGLVVVRDANYKFGGDDKTKGWGIKWGTGINHPRHAEFVREYGHVVDPASIPPLETPTAATEAA